MPGAVALCGEAEMSKDGEKIKKKAPVPACHIPVLLGFPPFEAALAFATPQYLVAAPASFAAGRLGFACCAWMQAAFVALISVHPGFSVGFCHICSLQGLGAVPCLCTLDVQLLGAPKPSSDIYPIKAAKGCDSAGTPRLKAFKNLSLRLPFLYCFGV